MSASLKKPIQGKQSDNLKRKIKQLVSLTIFRDLKAGKNKPETAGFRQGNTLNPFDYSGGQENEKLGIRTMLHQ